MNTYDKARQNYRPKTIRVVFIAEAAPENMERFFYYEHVQEHDSLFVNLMRTLYSDCRDADIKEIRRNKQKLLERFRDDGYYLIDALPEPITLKLSNPKREKLIELQADRLIKEVKELNPADGTVLIKATVFHSLYDRMVDAGVKIRNSEVIPFPGSGQQAKFRQAVRALL